MKFKVLIALFIFCFSGTQAEDVNPVLKEKELIPSFMLRNLSGKMVSIRDFCGLPRSRPTLDKNPRYNVIISFMASYCVPCKKEIPILQEFAKTAPEDLKIILISVDSLAENVMRPFAKQMKIKQTILLDKYGTTMKKFGVKKLPSLFVINKKGELVYQNLNGFPNGFDLPAKLKSVLESISAEGGSLSLSKKKEIVSYVLTGNSPKEASEKFNLSKNELLKVLKEANLVLNKNWLEQ